ncbi:MULTISPECIES: triose-phosphate isomerase [Methylobacterium]|jgi:triosephosphate isomerase|uniref:Triosephosphate isomerase n=1 Tax=Methylobacterium brachiatum TaxID=269660 RepID=A0AAJ1TKV7_9HYPH|nr:MULTISPECIES: triose-phosphate isomerase [Methylobacterium]AYO85739.1 triose-phosphate isomerase [Methylobacterium brachiatum]EIZ85548.1 Triose-phosphate isomerase [Methylobacterium sp. GXF4]MCB4802251.1 triose-phosphate isomerase [Methylobacterium brachiatum]MDF2601049.1 triosephosphate isomerase [Methylobacterium brachiatum]MDH2310699.1 triose-phosphate isomerase [Methylobacterium brachiatum]
MTQTGRKPLVAGNWKMNGTRASIKVVEAIRDGITPELAARVDVLICPPATLIGSCVAATAGSPIAIGGQNLHARPSGAFTGSISAEMLADLGAKYVIVGHSERRAYHHETDDGVHAKALGARRAGLCGIICVGETIEEREQGRALDIVRAQLAIGLPKGATAADTVIAYEPVWAIGSGRTPTPRDIAEVHASLREMLDKLVGDEAHRIRILYGGSVKPSNARELMAVENVDGALVGGASLVAEDFLGICAAYA